MLFQVTGFPLFDDLFRTIRFLTPVVMFYLAYVSGKRIKEAGRWSAITGFTIYLIGMALFQFGSLLETTYPLLDNFFVDPAIFKEWPEMRKDFNSFYNIFNYVYIIGMVIFNVLTEHSLIQLTGYMKRAKFKYIFSTFSVVSFFVLIALRFLEFISKGVFYVFEAVFLLILSIAYLKQFNSLYEVRRQKLAFWYFVGLFIGGMSNFLQNPLFIKTIGEWTYLLNSFIVLVGAFMQTWAWNRIPPLTELNWRLGLKQLVVIDKKSSVTLFQHGFIKEKQLAEFDITSTRKEELNAALTGSAIGGVASLLKELLKSEQSLNIIDHGDLTLYFNHSTYFTHVLITGLKSNEYSYRLSRFSAEFSKEFDNIVDSWEGDIESFNSAKNLVRNIFK